MANRDSIVALPVVKNHTNMKRANVSIPLYAADGTPWGFRTLETAQRLIANGHVNPVYGRKGHLRAIFSKQADGSSAVDGAVPGSTPYSFRTRTESGPLVWKLKRLGKKDELRPLFCQVVTDCLVTASEEPIVETQPDRPQPVAAYL